MAIGSKLAAAGEFIHEELATPLHVVGDGGPPEGRPRPVFDWGRNANGWRVIVRNLTDQAIAPWYLGSDMVHRAPRLIAPGATGVVKGKPDPLRRGSPADMKLDLCIGGLSNLLVVSRGPGRGKFAADVYGCPPWDFGFVALAPHRPLILAVRPGRPPQSRAA
ncbi:hypothetical protein [Streptomyces vinaceus]|uniref:hypothetical protein n=1 Tax=Streptomyces vinaceus TaxID=1960 RepID=UPI003699E331